MSPDHPPVVVAEHGDGIFGVQLNRPDKLNALDSDMLAALDRHVKALREQRARAVIVTGAGRVFCAGADIDELANHVDAQSFSTYLENMLAVFDRLACAPFLTIAGIHGVALGGGLELALACDVRVLAPGTSVGVPEVFLGALPGGGGIARLHNHLPPSVVREMVLLGTRLDAEDCERHGFASVSRADSLSDRCLSVARSVPTAGRDAIALGKTLLAAVEDERTGPQSQYARAAISQMVHTPAFRQGVDAFLARRSK